MSSLISNQGDVNVCIGYSYTDEYGDENSYGYNYISSADGTWDTGAPIKFNLQSEYTKLDGMGSYVYFKVNEDMSVNINIQGCTDRSQQDAAWGSNYIIAEMTSPGTKKFSCVIKTNKIIIPSDGSVSYNSFNVTIQSP